MQRLFASLLSCLFLTAMPANASDLEGPARFCGYAPIIDLEPGEKITILASGIHAGSFLWEGDFGSLLVNGIGWANRPKGRLLIEPSDDRPARFAQRKRDGKYIIAIWNGRQGAAYFESDIPFSEEQRRAIDRVRLHQEGETPSHCDLRSVQLQFWHALPEGGKVDR